MSQIQDFAEKLNAEIIDFTIDYTEDLAESSPGDTIVTSAWVVVGDLVIDDGSGYTDNTATVWVSGGGRNGNISRLTNTITTAGGRQIVRQLIVKMVNKLAYYEEEDPVTIPTD
jgi:hypothetical protein